MDLDSGNYSTCVNKNVTDDRVGDVVPLTIATSTLSIIGSTLTIVTFLAMRELRRSTVRQIIAFLAVADLLTSATYFMAGVAHYYFFTHGAIQHHIEPHFRAFCKAQAFLTSYFSIASFLWTSFLPMYFVLPLVFGVYGWKKRILLTYSLTGWAVPLLPCVVAISLGYLGPSHEGSNNALDWCFVSDDRITRADSKQEFRQSMTIFFVMQAVCLRMWEFLVYLITFTCYMMILVKKCQYRNKQYRYMMESTFSSAAPSNPIPHHYSGSTPILSMVQLESAVPDLKLLAVPFAFLLLRCWGTIRYFISMRPGCFVFVGEKIHSQYCLSLSCFEILFNPVLLIFQGFCDPLQGFVNAILFVVLSKRVRKSAYQMTKYWRRLVVDEECKDSCSKIIISYKRHDNDVASKYGSVGYLQ